MNHLIWCSCLHLVPLKKYSGVFLWSYILYKCLLQIVARHMRLPYKTYDIYKLCTVKHYAYILRTLNSNNFSIICLTTTIACVQKRLVNGSECCLLFPQLINTGKDDSYWHRRVTRIVFFFYKHMSKKYMNLK